MLLVIHNLPSHTRYSDVKALLEAKCGLTDLILDNLVLEGAYKKVTVGLIDDGDAAILVRKINGIFMNGAQLYVENVKQKMETDQPYRCNKNAPSFDDVQEAYTQQTNYLHQHIGTFQMDPKQMPAQPYQAEMPVMMNYNMMGNMYMPAMHMPQEMMIMPQEMPVPSMLPMPQNNFMGFGGHQAPVRSMQLQEPFNENAEAHFPQGSVQDPQSFSEQRGGVNRDSRPQNQRDRKRNRDPSPMRGRSPPMSNNQKKSRWESQQGGSIPEPKHPQQPQRNPREPFYTQNTTQDYDRTNRNQTDYFDRLNSAFERLGPKIRAPESGEDKFNRNFEQSSRDQVQNDTQWGDNDWRVAPEKFEQEFEADRARSKFGRNLSDRGRSRRVRSRRGEPRDRISERRQDEPRYDRYDSSSRSHSNKPETFIQRRNEFDGADEKRRELSEDRKPSLIPQFGSKPDNDWRNRPSGSQQDWIPKSEPNIPPKNQNTLRQSVWNTSQRNTPIATPQPAEIPKTISKTIAPSVKLTPVMLINRGQTWRDQTASSIAKTIFQDLGVDKAANVHIFNALKSNLRSRLEAIIGDELAISPGVLVEKYRKRYPTTEDEALFKAVEKNVLEKKATLEPNNTKTEVKPGETKTGVGKPFIQKEPTPYIQKAPAPYTQTPAVIQKAPVIHKQPIQPIQNPPEMKPTNKPSSAPNPANLEKKRLRQQELQMQRREMEEENPYDLGPVLQKALDEEADIMCDLFMGECSQKELNSDDKYVQEHISDQVSDVFRKLVRLHVMKRILNVTTGLKVRAFFSTNGRTPPKHILNDFFDKHGVVKVKEALRKCRMMVLSFDKHENFDKICAMGHKKFGDINVQFKPLYLTGPPMNYKQRKALHDLKNDAPQHPDQDFKFENMKYYDFDIEAMETADDDGFELDDCDDDFEPTDIKTEVREDDEWANDVKQENANDVKQENANDVKQENANDVKQENANDVKQENANDVKQENENDVKDEYTEGDQVFNVDDIELAEDDLEDY